MLARDKERMRRLGLPLGSFDESDEGSGDEDDCCRSSTNRGLQPRARADDIDDVLEAFATPPRREASDSHVGMRHKSSAALEEPCDIEKPSPPKGCLLYTSPSPRDS